MAVYARVGDRLLVALGVTLASLVIGCLAISQ